MPRTATILAVTVLGLTAAAPARAQPGASPTLAAEPKPARAIAPYFESSVWFGVSNGDYHDTPPLEGTYRVTVGGTAAIGGWRFRAGAALSLHAFLDLDFDRFTDSALGTVLLGPELAADAPLGGRWRLGPVLAADILLVSGWQANVRVGARLWHGDFHVGLDYVISTAKVYEEGYGDPDLAVKALLLGVGGTGTPGKVALALGGIAAVALIAFAGPGED